MVATISNENAQQTRYYSLPFISNYVRDENNNVYCTSTRCHVGIWSNSESVIVIDGDYYHGPRVEYSQNQHSIQIDFTPDPQSPPPTQYITLPDFFDFEDPYGPDMEPLELSDLIPEEGEIIELRPIEGASLFKRTDCGRVYFTQENELDDTIPNVGYTITKTLMGPRYYKKVVNIRFYPQYESLTDSVETPDIVIGGRTQSSSTSSPSH